MSKASPPKITYVTLSADESIHPKYEAALKKFEEEGLGRRYPMYIGEEEVWSRAGEFAHRSPLDTTVVVGHFQKGVRSNAKQAIERAKEGFEVWSAKDWKERADVVNRAADLIDQRKFEIAVSITYEVGKTRLEALAEAWEAVDSVNYCAKLMRENEGYVTKMGPGGPGESTVVLERPYGVWPVISPFNFPFMLASGMAIGALITGNAIILKPTSTAPLTGLMLYEAFSDAGVPPGAVNFVTGPGSGFEGEFVSS